jgi:class 3 adenylate cyclase
MSEIQPLQHWWRCIEESVIRGESSPQGLPDAMDPPLVDLAQAAVCEVRMDLDSIADLLKKTVDIREPWDSARILIDLRTRLRLARGDAEILANLRKEAEQLIESDPPEPTLARVHHFLGTLHIQSNRPGLALTALTRALERVGDAACRPWILDGISQSYLYLGARTEGRRSLRRTIIDKDRVDDHLGIAISSGSLALAEIQSGQPQAALDVLKETLERRGQHLATLSRLRLHTFSLQAALELDDDSPVTGHLSLLEECLQECGHEKVPPVGFARMARARALANTGQHGEALKELDRAAQLLRHPELQMLIDYWRVALTPADQRGQEQLQQLDDQVSTLEKVTEGEILARLLLMQKDLDQGERDAAIARLDDAYGRVVETNQPYWIELVDEAYRRVDPARQAAKSIERFSGRPAEEMSLTTTEDATIIFADLAGFTQRSTELSAEEVMETVRSVFELAVPLLAQHQVRPLQHLGDGLLAACQGEGHEARGLQFAIDLVERTSLASRVRREMGESWGLDLRAGVNSGPVVFGMLGSSFKQEWLAIGKTTNLAARLQSKGEIGEVVTLPELADRVGFDASGSILKPYDMKGFSEPVPVLRIPVE